MIFALSSRAQDKSAFEQALEQNQNITTEERWVILNGRRYREIKFEGKSTFILFRGRLDNFTQADCELAPQSLNPHLIEGGFTLFRRTKAYLDLVQETCEAKNGQIKQDISTNPRIGIAIPDQPKDKITKKKVFWDLGNSFGFSGEW